MKTLRMFLSVILILAYCAPLMAQEAAHEEAWKTEFNDLCGRTADSASMSKEELKKLIDRCDKLAPEIQKLPESPRKLYTKRLKMCRDMYQYALETQK